MPDVTESGAADASEPRRCPSCKTESPPGTEYCPVCGYPIAPKTRVPDGTTRQLARAPVTLPRDALDSSHLPPKANVILQFLPSGTCVTLPLTHPVILGRGSSTDAVDLLDLSVFNAVRHGVSRRHCKLERRNAQLLITDIGSANGTHLNHEALIPHKEYVVTHGDQIVLGTLHLFVAFSSTDELADSAES